MTTTEIEEHIVSLIRSHVADGQLIPLHRIDHQIPGGFWKRGEVITSMWQRGLIDIVKVSGSPLIGIPWPGWEHDPKSGPRRLLVA
ncbi:hypothetical protein [Gordonia malaquae]|uniref:hypothetical protein n=1 Tax=Gordonia malaquae TaxID=410332 RepID=UPI0030FEFEBD